MAQQTVRARCRQSRLIGDDTYAAGETYRMDAERAHKYAALGYFEVLDEPAPKVEQPEPEPEAEADAKQREEPANKMMAGPPNKGRPADRAG